MTREYGVCPTCFSVDIEALDGVLRRCRSCGKHFGQPRRPVRVVSRHLSELASGSAPLGRLEVESGGG